MATNKELNILVRENGNEVASLKTSQFPVVFGRSEDCQLILKNYGYISRVHGSISVTGAEVRVSDLNSSHGLSFKGEKNLDFRFLKKDKFTIGGLEFEVTVEESELEKAQVQNDKIVLIESETSHRVTEDGTGTYSESGKGFSILPMPEVLGKPMKNICLQAVITWGDDIFDVRNFYVGDKIKLSGREDSPIYIPFLEKKSRSMGKFANQGGLIELLNTQHWGIFEEAVEADLNNIIAEKRLIKKTNHFVVQLAQHEVLSADLGNDVFLHFRYVLRPSPFIRRTWIENREEFKKAIWTSGAIHFIASAFALVSTPQVEGPRIPDVPPRIAKLIVQPPPQILAPPVPVKPPEPEIKPQLVEKLIPKPEIKITKKIVEAVKKDRQEKVGSKVSKPQKPQPPPIDVPSGEQAQTQDDKALANLFSKTPLKKGGGLNLNSKDFKIANANGGSNNQGFGNLDKTLKTGGSTGVALGPGSGAGGKSNIGQIGFVQGKDNANTGKRGVIGSVVGTPKIANRLEGSQGLTNDEVMKVVNRYLGEIQRCYERALFSNSNLAGRIEYEWDITPPGSVASVRIKRSEMSSADQLNDCVMSVFRKMKFPASKNGLPTVANIGFPFGKL